jgi:putative transposase
MSRLPRIVVPGVAHHVTQRGNQRQPTFISEADYAASRDRLGG